MAKPIRNTPILYGADAKRFRDEISKLPSADERRKARQKVEEGAMRFLEMVEALDK